MMNFLADLIASKKPVNKLTYSEKLQLRLLC